MMSPTLAIVLFVALTTLAVAAFAYALLEPRISQERRAGTRLKQYKTAETDSLSKGVARDRVQEAARRRRNIQSSLKEIETRQRERDKHVSNPSLARRLEQAGLPITVRAYVVWSIVSGFVCLLFGLLFQPSLLVALGLGVIGGLGLPRWYINRRAKRRKNKFITEFPNAIDLIVRGIKAGLPLNDCLRMLAQETPEPVRGEFVKIVEAQQVGMTTAQAVERLYQNVPLAETNFFSIVITIQSQAGGNLSEALSNLSKVLRERKKMKAKIQAVSMEAKASGGIIGSLPVVVALLVYVTTPDYITLLFTNSIGNMILAASAIWMSIGVLVMKQMINFDF
ncbi:type II secretion system F family protein [Mangrovibrevibacter kandeliae]|uniref:type II secretion system F family protein n=1 Tax=Mangrovibrevibacter kandeliae TaxID=2968473 RepID=UPI003555CCE1